MMKILQIVFIAILYLFIFAPITYAIDPPCTPDDKRVECKFGAISPPTALIEYLKKDSTGAFAISDFLSRLVALIFTIATIVFIFMLVWGAFEWLTSGGDKEKLSNAQKRIINAIIGIILFAVAFAIIAVLGQFTGFRLFATQNVTSIRKDSAGNIIEFTCRDGRTFGGLNRDFAYVINTNFC